MEAVQRNSDIKRNVDGMSHLTSVGSSRYHLPGSIEPRIWLSSTPWRTQLVRAGVLAVADVVALCLCFGTAITLSPATETTFPAFTAVSLCVLGYFTYRGHYHLRSPFWTELRHIAAASFCALLFNTSLALASPQHDPVIMSVAAWVAFPIFALLLRKSARWVLAAAGVWQIRTLVVGPAGATSTTVAALKSEPWLGYEVVAIVPPQDLQGLGSANRWRSLMNAYRASLTILSLNRGQPADGDLISSLVRERVPFAIVPQPDGLPVLGYDQTDFFSHDTVLVRYRNNLAQPIARLVKMVFDVCAAGLGLVLAGPAFLIIALLVKLDGGPAFYGHTRLGSGARPFRCLKFRSMVVDSDAALERHLAGNPAAAQEWMQTRKLRNDPRITRVGRILRTTSLDELPQLLNVLRLEMSLVGPRPIVRAEMPHYGEDIAYYFEARPGLTGLWQVSGRTETTFKRRVELDCWYVKNWTLWHDVAILAKTVPAVLKRHGAV